MTYSLLPLPYAYDSLSPYLSAETLEFHHDKHHKAYVDKANELIGGSGLETLSLEKAIEAAYADKSKAGLFNQLGQHFNHQHFWEGMKKDGGGTKIPSSILKKIDADLGGYDAFRKKFIEAGVTQFGSGWAWLVQDKTSGQVEIMKTANADTPLVHGKIPLLVVDVWEHSYYIDYRNLRLKYLEAFVDHLINWEQVAQRIEIG